MSELPENWEPIKLGDAIELAYGKGLTKKVRNREGSYPVYGSNGIVDYHDTFLVPGPVIVVGRKGAAGIPTFSADSCWPIDTTYYVQESPAYDLKFMYYLLLSLRLDQFDRSTAIPGLNRDDAYALDIGLPPYNEQKRIVAKIEELFSGLDKGIENLKTAREQLKVYRQAVLKNAFEGKLTSDWREENKDKLETVDELLKRFECSYADNFLPNGWIAAKFKSVYEASQNGLSKRSGKAGKNIPVLRLADITNYKIVQNDLRSILLDAKEEAKYGLTNNDLLAIRVNGSPNLVGRMILAQDCNGMAYCDHFIRFRFNPSVILPEYVQHYFNTHKARRYIDLNKVSSAGQNTVSQATLGELDIPYCSFEEQKLLVDLLSEKFANIDSVIKEIEEQLSKAEALRQSILKQAFSGKLVAQNPKDEPTSVLLERIKSKKEGTNKKRNAA